MPISTMPPPPGFGYSNAYEERLAAIKAGYRKTLAQGGYPGAPVTEQELDVLAHEHIRAQPESRNLVRGQTNQRAYPDQRVRESERIASMALNRIWEQPTPSHIPVRAPFAYVNPSPPLISAHHVQLAEPTPVARAFYADGSYPAQTLADVRPDVIDGHLFDLEHRYIPRTWPDHEYGAAYEAIHIRAPHLSHRVIQHTFEAHAAYPVPRMYAAPALATVVSPPRTFTLNEALATWYAEQVMYVLIDPGMFRPGVGGASDDIWGTAGREKDAWDRVGMPIPHYSHRYAQNAQSPVARDTAFETYDPYNLLWKNTTQVNERLVSFIINLLQRMTIAPTAVISAVWYLHGLGLHDGDGRKGAVFRRLLRKESAAEEDGVENRVALLGLLLSGKWLDDNAFLTSSWSEVSLIPKKDIEQLEFAALGDLHHSLHIPMSSWSDFVNLRWAELNVSNGAHAVLFPLIDQMVSDARANEIWEPVKPPCANISADVEYYDYVDQRLEELYYASQDAETAEYTLRESSQSTPVTQWSFPPQHEASGIDEEMEDAARNVSALVDDEMDQYETNGEYEDAGASGGWVFREDVGDESEDESEDEFLDYDGAARFLPTISELRRSASNSSAQSDVIAEWRAGIVGSSTAEVESPPTPDIVQPTSSISPTYYTNDNTPSPYNSAPAPRTCSIQADGFEDEWRYSFARPKHHVRLSSSEARCEPFDHDAFASLGCRGRVTHASLPMPTNRDQLKPISSREPAPATVPLALPQPKFNPTGVYLEPGIAQVRPSRFTRPPLNTLFGMENQDPREAEIMAVLNPTGFTVPSRWD